jgi:hypothetical protein
MANAKCRSFDFAQDARFFLVLRRRDNGKDKCGGFSTAQLAVRLRVASVEMTILFSLREGNRKAPSLRTVPLS